MKILMVSINFYPSVGGIELVTENLSREFVRMGHQVTIITNTISKEVDVFPFTVLRNPKYKEVYTAYNDCDVFVHQAISLKYLWPLFFRKKPFFVVYHQVGWEQGIKGFIKRMVSYISHNICVSYATAKGYKLKNYDVIHNAYNDAIYKNINTNKRRNFIFAGRLESDKGVYLLIDAFNKFKESSDNDEKLILIGNSKYRNQIEEYAQTTQFSSSIIFKGQMTPKEVAMQLNEANILVVPSKFPYREAFGVVVLEGLACGCLVIGADGDGIEEAMGNAGFPFKNGDVQELTCAMIRAYSITKEEKMKRMALANKIISSQTMYLVSNKYINIFKKKLNKHE